MFNCIKRFKESLDMSQYYDAHEHLEEWWFPKRKTKTPEVLFVAEAKKRSQNPKQYIKWKTRLETVKVEEKVKKKRNKNQ